MPSKRKTPRLVTTSIITLITVINWIGFELYRIYTAKPDPIVPAEILASLNPILDEEVLNKLQERVYLEESQLPKIAVAQEPNPTSIPAASPSGESKEEVNE